MAAICSLQWINDRMKNLITNTCFISKVFYRCLMNMDCNVLTWIILIWHTCKPHTLHVYPLPALQRIECYPLITHFDACTVTQALHVQSRSLTHFSLVTFPAPKTLPILIHLSKYVDDIKIRDKCNKIMPLGSEINCKGVLFPFSCLSFILKYTRVHLDLFYIYYIHIISTCNLK